MKNVNEMSLEQKLMELQQCFAKAKVGVDYPGSVEYEFLMNCTFGESRDEKLAYIGNLLNNAQLLIKRGADLGDLEARLADVLVMFPGYTKELNQGLGR